MKRQGITHVPSDLSRADVAGTLSSNVLLHVIQLVDGRRYDARQQPSTPMAVPRALSDRLSLPLVVGLYKPPNAHLQVLHPIR